MKEVKTYKKQFLILWILLFFLFLVNVSLGSVFIPIGDVIQILLGKSTAKESWELIVINFRLPKAITALMVGSGLSVSGLMMQTLFRNPLAGPFVLGISSGASLGVAFLLLGSSFLGIRFFAFANSNWSLAIASSLGSFLVLATILVAANKVRNTMSILIIGLMFGSFAAAIISVLSYFSDADQIQQYVFWGFGSLGNLSWSELFIFGLFYLVGIMGSFLIVKPLNSFLLGENYAKTLGISIKKSRNFILLITALLTGVITAFAGPIAFVGLAVPHITKLIFVTSNHKVLVPGVVILGAIIMLTCDVIAQLPTLEYTLPINAITSLFGAPIVIWLLVRKKKMYV